MASCASKMDIRIKQENDENEVNGAQAPFLYQDKDNDGFDNTLSGPSDVSHYNGFQTEFKEEEEFTAAVQIVTTNEGGRITVQFKEEPTDTGFDGKVEHVPQTNESNSTENYHEGDHSITTFRAVSEKRRRLNEERYKCKNSGCSSPCTCLTSLMEQQKTHTEQEDHLIKHQRIDTGEEPFKCDFKDCSSTFTRRYSLIIHRRIHTGEKPFKCDYNGCSSTFTQAGSLIIHRRIHTGEKPFKCDFKGCSWSFTQAGNLITHQRIHTGEKPFKCDFKDCSSTFTRKSNLIIHRRIHTGEKPFKCDKKVVIPHSLT